ncbi:hypothetical protein [Rhizobium sp. 11_C7_N12_5]|uniref:hypothetical protein n=1 Tax=Rhizobium sp. 11_C7_N12_5 TaxID=3240770 RepID=UPI003F233EA5
MFTKALTANMEPPTGTLASSDAEMENEGLVDQLKDGFPGSVRLRKKILSFNVDHFTRTDRHNFEAIIHWKGSGAANVIKGHVCGYEQCSGKRPHHWAGRGHGNTFISSIVVVRRRWQEAGVIAAAADLSRSSCQQQSRNESAGQLQKSGLRKKLHALRRRCAA